MQGALRFAMPKPILVLALLPIALPLAACSNRAELAPTAPTPVARSGNPITPGWYADPDAVVFDGRVYIYPTFSAPYGRQMHFDAFSSCDLVNWTAHPHVLRAADVRWARRAMWAPSVVQKDGRFYLFFAANDLQKDGPWGQDTIVGGIGVAVADSPAGPFADLFGSHGRPLIDRFHNGAQPIDQHVWRDDDGTWYIVYGGWRRCNIAKLADDFASLVPFDDGAMFKEITPKGYVEGPIMFRRTDASGRRRLYFMWSEGGWTGADYSVAYAVGDSPLGPFERIGTVLQQNPQVATGAGHHSVLSLPATSAAGGAAAGAAGTGDGRDWYIVYHRRPLGQTDPNQRVVCIDRMEFDPDGHIKPVIITFEGVPARAVAGTP